MNIQHLNQVISDNNLTGTNTEIATQLNLNNITTVQNIKVADLNQYLIVTTKILAIKASSEPVALLTVEALNAFTEFVMTNPANAEALTDQIDGLIGLGLLDPYDKTYILSLGQTTTSLSVLNGLGKVREGDVEKARGQQ